MSGGALVLLSLRLLRWGDQAARIVDEFLGVRLPHARHRDGFVLAESLRLRPVGPNDPFWRCGNCGRVHLHFGAEICTRCYVPLGKSPTGTAAELRRQNYLGLRYSKGIGLPLTGGGAHGYDRGSIGSLEALQRDFNQ